MEECGSYPCQHNSTCVETGAEFRCDCSPGYTGIVCETGKVKRIRLFYYDYVIMLKF